MQSSPVLSLSPSFNSYSSGKLAEIAARVVDEFGEDSESEFEDEEKSSGRDQEQSQVEEDHEDDDFEFHIMCGEPNSSPISADEIFYNGQIRPVFPLFNRDLLFDDVENGDVTPAKPPTPSPTPAKPPTPSSIRIPLRKLLLEDRHPLSCSSSEADDLEGIPTGTYCVWTPKSADAAVEESPGRRKKSHSTGSSKRWKFRDLLHRSNSDGKDTFVFLTPSNGNAKTKEMKAAEKAAPEKRPAKVKASGKVNAKVVGGKGVPVTAAHEGQYVRNRGAKDGDHRRRSFLPYRQDLVGFFANVNGLSRNVHPF